MLYKIGTLRELYERNPDVPRAVFDELTRDLAILDAEYGENRNYLECGGYAVILESCVDIPTFREIVNFDTHPCEWATHIGRNSGYLSALYIMNDDFSIMAFMPIAIAPDAILNDLED